MKRLITIISLLLLSLSAVAQGPLKFMGIPIDGTRPHFESQLKAKGFRYDSITESFKGEFNGQNVDVYVHSNHNVVDRVYVSFPRKSEQNIRIQFNNLLSQFPNL